MSNEILKNGIDHSYIGKDLEVFYGIDHSYIGKDLEVFYDDNNNNKTELEPDKSNCTLLVDVVEFFDYVTKQKIFVLVYSPYKELKQFGKKFERKGKSQIGGYSMN